MTLQPGTRVRLNTPCIWPERAGCLGTVVAPPTAGQYPQPAKWEVLVDLDADPLATNVHLGWSCVLNVGSVTEIREPTEIEKAADFIRALGEAFKDLDLIEVPRSFVESVLYSGSFDRAQLDDLHRRAQELLDG